MSKKILMTRHGETEWNTIRRMQGHKNSPLTDFGIQQAKWLKERLKDDDIDVIYTSPLGRAYETAIILSKGRDIEVITRDELKEIYLGSWEGQRLEEVEKTHKEINYYFWNEPEKYIPIDGESFEELIDRSKRFFNEVLLESEHKNILVVAHAVVLKSFLAYTKGKEVKDLWEGPHLQPTSLTKAELVNGELIYEFIGDTSHHEAKSDFNGWFHDEG